MSVLQALANLPVMPPAASAASAQADQGQANGFSGVLDSVTTAGADDDGSALRGLGQRGRKATNGGVSADTSDTGTRDEPGAGDNAGPGATSPTTLDISTLAQMAAALTPASPAVSTATPPQGGTGAATPSTTAAAVAPGTATPVGTTASAPARVQSNLGTGASMGTTAASRPANASSMSAPPVAGVGSGLTAKDAGAPAAVVGAAQPAANAAPTIPGGASATSAPDLSGAAATPAVYGARDPAAASQATTQADAATGSAATAGVVPNQMDVTPKGSGTAGPATSVKPASSKVPAPAAAGGSTAATKTTASADGSAKRGDASSGDAAVTTPSTGPSGATPVAATLDPTASPATPAQQVVSALQSLAPGKTEQAPRTSASASASAVAQAPATTSGVKSLTIQLNPGHLGPVSITVRMQADGLDIQIAVSNPQALHLLERDRHALTAAVEAMGGSAEALKLGETASAEGGTAQNQSFASGNGAPRQETSSDAAMSGRQNRSAVPEEANQSETDDPTSAPPAAPTRSRDSSLYL